MSSEFKFVVDGVELSEKQHALIAQAVSEAGTKALAEVLPIEVDVITVDVSRFRRWEWIGKVAFVDQRAGEIAEQVRAFTS
jgi:hypothetical protein